MANLKEIVTKAVIGKTKKTSKDELIIESDSSVDTVLGCWVINHTFSGQNNNGVVELEGSFDINVWYAHDNNTKTNVLVRNVCYKDNINVKLKNDANLNNQELIIRSLKAPSVVDVKAEGFKITLITEKELGVEIVGDTKIRISAEDDYDDYEEECPVRDLNMDINENYLNSVNQ